jgi:hypothetical protein
MKAVEASFIKHKKHDGDTRSHSYGETNDVDGGKDFVLPKIPPRDLEIILYHKKALAVSYELIAQSSQLVYSVTLFVTISPGWQSRLLLPGN